MSSSDQVRLPSEIFQLIEELRCRKAKDKDTEANMKLLVKEKFELEKSLDSLNMKMKLLEAEHLLKLDEINVANVNQSVAKDEKLKRQMLIIEASEKAIENLRNEISKFQLANFTLERKVSEQNKKIAQNSSFLDAFTKQKLETEMMIKSFKENYIKVNDDLLKLNSDVKECVKINNLYTNVINNLKKELTQANLNLEKAEQNLIGSNANQERTKIIERSMSKSMSCESETDLSALKNYNNTLVSRMKEKETQYADLLETVANFQALVGGYSEAIAGKSLKIKQLEESLEKATQDISKYEEQIELVKGNMQKIIASNADEKKLMLEEFNKLKSTYDESILACDHLKTLNNELREINANLELENEKLSQIIEQDKATKYSKHLVDRETEIDLSLLEGVTAMKVIEEKNDEVCGNGTSIKNDCIDNMNNSNLIVTADLTNYSGSPKQTDASVVVSSADNLVIVASSFDNDNNNSNINNKDNNGSRFNNNNAVDNNADNNDGNNDNDNNKPNCSDISIENGFCINNTNQVLPKKDEISSPEAVPNDEKILKESSVKAHDNNADIVYLYMKTINSCKKQQGKFCKFRLEFQLLGCINYFQGCTAVDLCKSKENL